ncbi:tyrosine-protein phosphatase [Leifsonia poae]|uniref:tyrosine-protein phosphatase n=1 Tax=Leifsonia poae TaxID=110933 RepID=UPI001CBE2CC0|nr:tyrosine-protein phosphatase [Leifsonia poae]
MSTPPERIQVSGTYNFRDVGGYPVAGGRIRSRKLFRSDGLHSLGETGKEQLRELGVKVVIDLRDEFEVQALPDDLAGLGVDVLRLPVFEGSGGSQSTIGATLNDMYAKIALQHRDVVVSALREIADTSEAGVVVHCTAGKDRTGIVVALALLAVGVDRETVVADYAATEDNLRGPWLERMLQLVESHGVAITPGLRAIMGGSPPEALESVLDLIDRDHGGVRAYLLDAGFDEIELAELRSVLVEPA